MVKTGWICSRAIITRTTYQMTSWDNLVAAVTPPFVRRNDIACTARISPKVYEVYLQALARIRLRANHPSWVSDEHTIQSVARVTGSYERGKVYLVLKDQKKYRLRFITASAVIDNPRQIVANARIGLYPNQIQANACILR